VQRARSGVGADEINFAVREIGHALSHLRGKRLNLRGESKRRNDRQIPHNCSKKKIHKTFTFEQASGFFKVLSGTLPISD